MKWWNIFKAAAPPERKPSDDPARAVNNSAGRKSAVNYNSVMAANSAMAHPIVFRCIHKIAVAVQTVPWRAVADPSLPEAKRAKKGTLDTLNAVLQSPNDLMTGAQLRYWMAINKATYGRMGIKVGMGALQEPNAMYPLAADQLSLDTDEKGNLLRFLYGNGDKAEPIPPKKRAEPGKAYAFEISTPGLEAGKGAAADRCINALQAIGLPSQITRLLLQRAIDTASGHPNTKYLIIGEKTLTNKQKKDIIEHIENTEPGQDSSGNVLFLYNASFKVEKLDNELNDIHSKVPMDDMTRMIYSAFGIPIALAGLGAADAAKFAGNFDGSRRSFWEDTIIPEYLTPMAQGLTSYFAPPGAIIEFDYDGIPALAEARAVRAKEVNGIDYLTYDEKRKLAGFGPLEDKKLGASLPPSKSAAPAAAPESTGNATP